MNNEVTSMDLSESRDRIQAIDRQMAALFVQRMEAARDIAAYKRERGLRIEDDQQETRVVAQAASFIEDEELRSFYLPFLQDTIKASARWQHYLTEGLRVAYCGVEGAFASIAAKRIFPDSSPQAFPSFEDAYQAVVSGACEVAVLPIENSYAGEVGQVLDLMYAGSLHVNGVYDLPVVHNLLATENAQIGDVRTVISHPQALAQCRAYIYAHGFAENTAPNTAIAAQKVAALKDPTVAAIASSETARLYGLKVLDHDINSSSANTTRFAVFSRVENTRSGDPDDSAFILTFTVKDEAGGLAKAINIIGAYGFNMRVLRSRPMKDLPWHYYFYVEAEGNDTSDDGQRMLAALASACPTVKVAGRYRTSNCMLVENKEATAR